MDLPTMVMVGVISLIVISILSKISKSLFRVAGLAFVGLAIYALVSGRSIGNMVAPTVDKIFERNNIVELNAKFCQEDRQDRTICECIVGPIYNDVESRIGTRRLSNMVNKPEELKQETLNSIEFVRPSINSCIAAKGKDKIKILELIKQISPLGN